MTLWTAADAAAATGGQATGWAEVSGLAIDNREVAPGDLFIALKGENHDGHAFASAALEAGAAALMVHDTSGLPDDAPILKVDDTFTALEKLGLAGRARAKAQVIAVTGSVGKTSTKDMLRMMLGAQGATHAAVRSFNNHWGVPLTLARMPVDAAYAVIEIGMNNPGEIAPLSRMARPHVAMITTVEAAHLAAFASVEAIADEKAAICAGLQYGGTAILPADNAHFDRMAAATSGAIMTFGETGQLARLIDARVAGDTTVVRAEFDGQPLTFKIGTPGVHFARNALAALAAVHAVGADPVRAALDLAAWAPPSGRGMKVPITLANGSELTLLDESYNANPASLGAALAVLAAADSQGRKVAFLGDMLELGPTETDLHARMATQAAQHGIDRVHTCGPLMRHLHDALPTDKRGIWAEDSAALAAQVRQLVGEDDVVMVKGSLGARMAKVVAAIKALGAPDKD